jgi:hypothetical protein
MTDKDTQLPHGASLNSPASTALFALGMMEYWNDGILDDTNLFVF